MGSGRIVAARAPFPLGTLALLAAAIFVCVTCEFLLTGLVPEMAAELGVSESRIGLLVTAFAATVAVSTTPLAIATRALPRKPLMVGLLVVFAASALLAAIAPSYELVVVARVLGGLAHGLFWAVTGPYASHLVDPAQLARALAITGAGVTLAFILGVPVVRPVVAETTALGAAYAAGLAVGFWKDTDELEKKWQEEKRWEPSIDDSEREALLKVWKKAVTKTFDWTASQ